MKIRDATIKDLKNIADSQLEFCLSEGMKKEEILYNRGKDHIENDLLKYSEFKKIIINDKDVIVGGLFMEIEKNYYNDETILSDKMFFTSPDLSGYIRIKIAVTLIKEGIKWAYNNNAKYFRMNMIFTRPSIIKFMKRMGFYVSRISYEMELKYNG